MSRAALMKEVLWPTVVWLAVVAIPTPYPPDGEAVASEGVDKEVGRDLGNAGAALSTFAPGGLWGLAVGGAFAIFALVLGALKPVWRVSKLKVLANC